ncbi:MAG: NapC/NirT family cytochrome c [Planctomycetes bacterium]|nr:NapC/NirT family cytochrome c [Planctomycetota bacterium]MCB9889508.1 NapC/NirT family cytochrome c [Planctomycetota bacterium]
MIRSNWISTLGAAVATVAAMGLVTTLALEGRQGWDSPYLGLLTVVLLPLVTLGGLLLIPFGLLLYRRQLAARIEALSDRPMRTARAVVMLTAVNFLAVGTAGYSGAEYLSSQQFCGKACHKIMWPEAEAARSSPHANVQCVQCHVGEGAQGFIHAKLNGVAQLLGTFRNDYHRPIPTPVEDLPPTKAICERCHSPRRYLGTKLVVKTHFEPNEKNTGFVNVLLMRRGGELPGGRVAGIHWHAHPSSTVEYLPGDVRRRTIPWVRARFPDGRVEVYAAEGFQSEPDSAQLRRMDCTDCHNRVGHQFATAEEVVDGAMATGLIPRHVPFIRKKAAEVLQQPWTREGAAAGIRAAVTKVLAGTAATPDELQRTAEALSSGWLRNNDPDRKLEWGSYPTFTAHDGCFRCHDNKHKNAKGEPIASKCSTCHVVLSERQENPAVLETLGIRPK